jgi:hypothetical protein
VHALTSWFEIKMVEKSPFTCGIFGNSFLLSAHLGTEERR